MPLQDYLYLRVAHDVMLDMGKRARALRLQQNVTQAELARRLGISAGTVKRFEKTGIIQFGTLLDIAQFFGRLDDFDKALLPSYKPVSLFDYKEPKVRKRASRKQSSC